MADVGISGVGRRVLRTISLLIFKAVPTEMVCEDGTWMELVEDCVQWWAVWYELR
jgi:hypothetical protein